MAGTLKAAISQARVAKAQAPTTSTPRTGAQSGERPCSASRHKATSQASAKASRANQPKRKPKVAAAEGAGKHQLNAAGWVLMEREAPSRRLCVRFTGATPAQARLNSSEPLVPPKPKLFFSAASIFMGRASLAQ